MASKLRDEFSKSVKDKLARRVGSRCSNPGCRQPTSGPQESSSGSVNIGVAAHITAAALGGPRYEPGLSEEDRASTENGIWLCQNCAKLIDSDEKRYTLDVLRSWKSQAEDAAHRDLEKRKAAPSLSPHELLGSELDDLKADPEIGHLISEGQHYYFGSPGHLGGVFRKGYRYFLTPDGRKCVLPRSGEVLLVRNNNGSFAP